MIKQNIILMVAFILITEKLSKMYNISYTIKSL